MYEIVDAAAPLPIRLEVEEPLTVGADRIINTLAASRLYGRDTVVVDLGTATTFHGMVDDVARNALVGASRAAILPGEEDFGLVPLEAAAAGRPTIAYAAGGALETIVDGETGAFFARPDPRDLAAALRTFDPSAYDPARLRAHAELFRPERFVARLRAIVDETRAG